MTRNPAKLLIPAQGVIAIVALVGLTMWPPASGDLLLVPLAGADANGVAKAALAGGAVLLGAGPLPGSMVVVGDRSRIARQIGSWDIVILAAPPAGCRATGTARGLA